MPPSGSWSISFISSRDMCHSCIHNPRNRSRVSYSTPGCSVDELFVGYLLTLPLPLPFVQFGRAFALGPRQARRRLCKLFRGDKAHVHIASWGSSARVFCRRRPYHPRLAFLRFQRHIYSYMNIITSELLPLLVWKRPRTSQYSPFRSPLPFFPSSRRPSPPPGPTRPASASL